MSRKSFRRPLSFCVLIAAAVVSGCAGDANPVRDIFVATGFGATTPPAPDFVSSTRPTSTAYIPIGRTPPSPVLAAKTKAEVEALESDLKRIREGNEAQAQAAKSLAATPAPAPVKAEPVPALAPDSERTAPKIEPSTN